MAELTADILSMNPGPALSATSDMPVEGEAAAPAANGEANAAQTPADGAAPAAEAAIAEGEGGADGEAGEGEAAAPPVDGETPPAEPAKRPRQGINERFSDLTTARNTAQAEARAQTARAEAAERALQEAMARIPKVEEKPPEPPPQPQPKPMRESFDSPDAYDAAVIGWARGEERREAAIQQAEQEQHAKAEKETAERAAAETAQSQSFKTMQDAHAARVEAAKVKRPDYLEVAEREDLKISLPMAMAIMQSEDGTDAAYYLGEHPEIAERIAGLVLPGQVFPPGHALAGQPVPDVQKQLLEMGKVFAAVAQPATPARRETPPPPPPITPLRRGGGPAVARTLEEIGNEGSMDDYAARRLPELQAERRPGIFGGGAKPN